MEDDTKFENITQGTYGKIMRNKDEVIKRLHVYETDKLINYCTIRDLVFSTYVKNINGCPRIKSITIIKDYADILMPYYGITLFEWVNTSAYSHENCMKILMTLIEILLRLHDIGIQNTDIKPENIMITPENDVILIDYNLCSIPIQNNNDWGFNWSNSVGTWVYTPPEICKYEIPHNNSTSWYIGFIIIFLFTKGEHPSKLNNIDINRYNKQRKWLELLLSLKNRSIEHYPLHLVLLQYLTTDMYNIYKDCCKWRPGMRISLSQLYKRLKSTEYIPVVINNKIFKPINLENRIKNMNTINSILQELKLIRILCRSITLYDLIAEKWKEGEDENEIIIGSICLSFIITYEFFNESVLIKYLLSKYPEEYIATSILKIGEILNWDCYYICADTMVITSNRNIFNDIFNIILNTKEEYTMQNIIDKY